MRIHWSIVVCMVVLLACSTAIAQQTCDFEAVGPAMENAAAEGNWDSAYQMARQIAGAAPEDLSTLSADHQYWLGLAHMYLMAQSFDMAEEGLEDGRSELASQMSEMVLNPQVEDVRTVSHGEQIELSDYLVPGQNVIFDFYSKYCGPCLQIAPAIEAIANQRDDVVLVKVDINRPGVDGIDWKSPVAQQYELRSIPHFKIYGPDGELKAEGQQAMQQLQQWAQEG